MKVQNTNNGVTLIKDEFTFLHIWLPVITLFFTAFAFPDFYESPLEFYKKLESGNYPPLRDLIIFFCLFYWSLVWWINEAYIFANNEVITIKYGPLPYPFFCNRTIKKNMVKFLYIKIKQKKSSSEHYYYDYILKAKMKNATSKRLLTFSSREGFLVSEYNSSFLKELLENNLNIEVEVK